MGLRIEVTKVAKAYNGNPVLRDCSYNFAPGLTYALQGPNGSGKSTLLRFLALLEAPDTGSVDYLENSTVLPINLELRRRFTLVLPRPGIFNTTVFNNVAYGLKIRGVKSGEIEARVDTILETVGLSHKRSQRALDLSSGETKRLGLARAMVLAPEILFLDEPTANIDPLNTDIIEEIILKMKAGGQTTILLITHDPAQAERLGDRLLLMKEGKLVPG
ncbi:MAG: ATP-binding cassette domain-containing protein [Deltaproteobacteria bacterium]|nr:ATP-binding cassette domain-containing protein [Deltaproteobacteria bacterium]